MLKNLIFILSLVFLATSCNTLRSSSSRASSSSSTVSSSASPASGSSIQFINNISIKPEGQQGKTINTVGTTSVYNSAGEKNTSGSLEKFSNLQFKYAILEDAGVEEMKNQRLLDFMEEWYGTRYHYGGTSKEGIDCSAFAYSLMTAVYGLGTLPRTAKEQYAATKRIRRDELQEGDLVFFHTLGKHRAVTHVGVYLRNNKFVHASISGVMISDMNEGYYNKRFIGAGRMGDQVPVPIPVLPAQASPGQVSN
ncbi:C40 family peptidase [Flavitalea flava]